jgi:hypothetical protein
MNRPCRFSDPNLKFEGTPIEQARCLLRSVRVLGNVNDEPATLPAFLEEIIGQPVAFTRDQLATWLAQASIAKENIGGSLSDPVSQTSDGKLAAYFMIHDTSDELPGNSFPTNINTTAWSPNDLTSRSISRAHVFINRLGESASETPYHRRLRLPATKFEQLSAPGHGQKVRGLFLHHELVQPRIKGGQPFHAVGPTPGFPDVVYDRLALCYLAASVRRGEWLIPAFHGVLDLGIPKGHDDPQNFDLPKWSDAISRLLAEVTGGRLFPEEERRLKSEALKGDTVLEAVANGHSKLTPSQARSSAVARFQRALNKLADTTPEYFIDLGPDERFAGFYGSKTAQAVSALQRNQGLAVIGEVGSATLLALDSELVAAESGIVPVPDPHDPGVLGANPVGPPRKWETAPGFAQDKGNPGKGFAKTSGIRGTAQSFDDGSVVMVGKETLEAKRGQTLFPSVEASQRRVVKNRIHEIEQDGYCHSGRKLPNARFIENHPGLTGPGVRDGFSTQFGKSDDLDEGTGSETFGITQTSSEVCGCSVKKSILIDWFGAGFAQDPRRLRAMVEVHFPRRRRYARVPLTDVGPSETVRAVIDLTWAVDQFLGTDGGDDVQFRLDPESIT